MSNGKLQKAGAFRQNTPAMNRAGAVCGCAALFYVAARWLLTRLAGALLALGVPGASLANPAGVGPLAAALLRMAVSALALAAPFMLLRLHPLAQPLALGRGRRGLAPGLFLLFWAAMLAGNLLAALAGPAGAAQLELPPGGWPLAAAYLTVCLLPAVGEECLFRGLIQGWLRPWGPGAAVAGQAVLFALLHGRLPACLAALFGGLALGLCAALGGSLRLGMALHLYNNTLAFAGQYAQQYGGGLVYYILLFAPALAAAAALFAGRHSLPARPRPQPGGQSPLWLLRCPGYLCAAGALAVFCAAQTFFA